MQILTVDVGTGTQDILLFDSQREIENNPSLIMPSPTARVAAHIRDATLRGEDLLLTGVNMGGGPSSWAARDHLKAGFKIYATPQAASTFDDDPSVVRKMGVELVSEDEAQALRNVKEVQLRDLEYESIEKALKSFGVALQPDVVAIAVFDHGAAPPGVSDRIFRFGYISKTVRQRNDLAAFAYAAPLIPEEMTRFRAVAHSLNQIRPGLPLVVMDTAPAAVLGALDDRRVSKQRSALVVNVGNSHALAFHLAHRQILALFEHHTGSLSRQDLERYLQKLANGTISNHEVYAAGGHGALVVREPKEAPGILAVTGPRQRLLRGSPMRPYFAVPHGNMMLAGCYGLLRAAAALMPDLREEIEGALSP